MRPARPRTKHAKRIVVALFAVFVAAGAMAYAPGGWQHHHDDEAPRGPKLAGGGSGSGAGDTELPIQESGASGRGDGGGPPRGGPQIVTTDTPDGAYGLGGGTDGPPTGAVMPSVEDGLMLLADHAQGRDGGANGDNTPSLPPAIPDAPGAGDQGAAPVGGEGSQAGSGGGLGGSGGGGFGGGGGSPGGGGGGIGGGTNPPTSGPMDPGPGSGPESGPESGPGGGFPDLSGGGGGFGDGGGGRDNSGGNVCIVNCGPPFAADGPKTDGFSPPFVADGLQGGLPEGDQSVAGSVPEPSAWLMMIVGLGAAGSVVRVQRRKAGAVLA